MQSQPEDPRVRKVSRKDKGPLRVGDAVDGSQHIKQKENPQGGHQANTIHVPFSQNGTVSSIFFTDQPILRKANMNNTIDLVSTQLTRSPTNAALQGIKRAAESPINGRKTIRTLPLHESHDSAVPRRPLEAADISITQRAIVQPEWTKFSSYQNFYSFWEISQRLSNQHAISQARSQGKSLLGNQLEKEDEGVPRKINHEDSLLPMTNSTNAVITSMPTQNVPPENVLSSHPQADSHEKKVVNDGVGNGVNNQNLNPNTMMTNHTEYVKNDAYSQQNMFLNTANRLSAEGLLLNFMQNQNNAIMAALANRHTAVNSFNASARMIPPGQTNFLENLKVDLVFPNKVDAKSMQQSSNKDNKCLNNEFLTAPLVNYYLLLYYFISEQAKTNKTNNIFLLLDRIQHSMTHQYSFFSNIPTETKVRHLKQYFPHLAAIQKWRQYITNLIKNYQNTVQNLHKRNTLLVEEKLLKLKLCAANGKKAVDLLNQTMKTMAIINDETRMSIEMLMAYSKNDRIFTYVHPSDPMLYISQIMVRDYHNMREKTNDMLAFTPVYYGCCKEVQIDGVSILREFLDKLAQEGGNLVDLQARVRRMKKKTGQKLTRCRKQESGYKRMKEQWRMMDLLSQVGSLLRKRSNNKSAST